AATYPSRTQVLRSAIALAEWGATAGRPPAVLIRDEDGRFFTVWVIGRDQRPNKRARLGILPRHRPNDTEVWPFGAVTIRTNSRPPGSHGRGPKSRPLRSKEFPHAFFFAESA